MEIKLRDLNAAGWSDDGEIRSVLRRARVLELRGLPRPEIFAQLAQEFPRKCPVVGARVAPKKNTERPVVGVEINPTPYHEMPFLNAPGGKNGIAVRERLPFYRGRVIGLPSGSPTMIATGDLQGRSHRGDHPSTLLGCEVADQLVRIQESAGLPDPSTCVGILAGDFYTVPNAAKRGGTGDVTEVWNYLRRRLVGIAGVLGNHDIFGEAAKQEAPPAEWLDGRVVEIQGLRIGGVSGIVGEPGRTNRRGPDEFTEALLEVLVELPHIVVLHAAPRSDDGAPGEGSIAATLKSVDFSGLVICGHVHWHTRVQRCGKATILNVDGAVVTLVR